MIESFAICGFHVYFNPANDSVEFLDSLAARILECLLVGVEDRQIIETLDRGSTNRSAIVDRLESVKESCARLSIETTQQPKATSTYTSLFFNSDGSRPSVFDFPNTKLRIQSNIPGLIQSFQTHYVPTAAGAVHNIVECRAHRAANEIFFFIEEELVKCLPADSSLIFPHLVELCFQAVRDSTPTAFTIHGAGLEYHSSGNGIIFPALGGSGKSTLATFLISKGWKLINDDVISVTPDFMLKPVPSNISVKEGSWNLIGEFFPALNFVPSKKIWRDSGLVNTKYYSPPASGICKKLIPCNTLIIPSYNGACTETQIQTVSPIETIQHVFSCGGINVQLPLNHKNLHSIFSWLLDTRTYRVKYSCMQSALSEIDLLCQ